MSKPKEVLPSVVTGIVVTTLLAAVAVPGGWLLLFPTGLALAVLQHLRRSLR